MAMATTAHSFTPPISSNSISGDSRVLAKADCTSGDSFPAGLRVLVVDDDPICLLILDRMLRRCQYKVTTCGRAADALAMLRENRDSFDVIISDVYMPDMDGFKLLELVGLEMDLPVIMMSANGETSAVMKGIKHGACDYLLKPVRMEELRNIWQHVVRKKWRSSAQQVASEDEKARHANDDGDHHSSANDGYDGTWKQNKKRRDLKEEEEEADLDPDDPSTTKKPRVVWSVELHQQFVNAVNQLGIDKAVPKRILELMNVHGLTRENVASHLQKYRLYLKRISAVAHQSGTLSPSFQVSNDSSFGPASANGLGGVGDFRALGGPNELSSQALLSSLQAGVLGRLSQANTLGMGNVEKSNFLQIAALQGAGGGGALGRPPFLPSYGQPVSNDQAGLQAGQCDINSVQQLAQLGALSGVALDKLPLGLSALQQQQLESAVGLGGLGQLSGNFQQVNPNTNSLLMQALQQQKQAAGGHLLSTGGLTMPTSGNIGQQGLSTDAGVWATAISSLNGSIRLGSALPGQYGASSRLGSIPGAGSQGALGRVPDQECKGQQVLTTDAGVWGASLSNMNATSNSGSGIPSQNSGLLEFASSESAGPASLERSFDADKCSLLSSPGNVPSSMSISGPDGQLFGRMKDLNPSLSSLNVTSPQSLGSRFPGLKQTPTHASQRVQGAWQRLGLGQDYGQIYNNSLQSPGCSSRGSSGNQCLPLVSEQDQGDVRGPGFNAGFAANFNNDNGSMKAFQHEQLRGENILRVKNEGQGWLPEPLSDELFSIVLRQQQEGLGLTE